MASTCESPWQIWHLSWPLPGQKNKKNGGRREKRIEQFAPPPRSNSQKYFFSGSGGIGWSRSWRGRWSTRSSTGSNPSPGTSSSSKAALRSSPISVTTNCFIIGGKFGWVLFFLFLYSNLDINGDVLHASVGLPPALHVTKARVGKLEITVTWKIF